MGRKYYEAYEDRYRQVHGQDLQWFMDGPSPIVAQVMEQLGIGREAAILEIGCGEGRDAGFLLEQGYRILATDISPEAVAYSRRKFPAFADAFQVLDCLSQRLEGKFDFIYAVAVLHMLVEGEDRAGFYRFIREQLLPGGAALICTMGDGETERQSDPATAFCLQERIHEPTGRQVRIAGTTCRMVSWETFRAELARSGLTILRQGMTAIEPDFSRIMYAVVTRKS